MPLNNVPFTFNTIPVQPQCPVKINVVRLFLLPARNVAIVRPPTVSTGAKHCLYEATPRHLGCATALGRKGSPATNRKVHRTKKTFITLAPNQTGRYPTLVVVEVQDESRSRIVPSQKVPTTFRPEMNGSPIFPVSKLARVKLTVELSSVPERIL